MKKKLIVLSSIALGFAPFLALAQNATPATSGACNSNSLPNLGTIQSIICRIGNILDTIIPVLIVLGIVYFIYGVVMFVIASDEEAKTKGRNSMIYGIIGLVVIVSMWGLVGIVTKTFDLNGTANITIPTVPF